MATDLQSDDEYIPFEDGLCDKPFSVKTWKEDLTLDVEDRKLYVAKNILASVSPVFDCLFSSEFREKDSDRLSLPNKNFKTFFDFLCCIYPGVDGKVTDKNAADILPLVDEYQVDYLKKSCENLLLESVTADSLIDHVYYSLSLSLKYNLEGLKQRCIEMASEHDIAEMMLAKEKYGIPSDVHEQVLAFTVKRLQLDGKEYSAALHSAKRRHGDLRTFTSNIFEDGFPEWNKSGVAMYSISSYYPKAGQTITVTERKKMIKALRLSLKLDNKEKMKILVKICRDRSAEEMEEIENEDEVRCLTGNIKDFILKKTSVPPENLLWG